MYNTGAPRNWVHLRPQQRSVITCIDASYSSAAALPRLTGIHSNLRCEACSARYFCINYPNPAFTLPLRSLPSGPEWTANLPYKARYIRRTS